MRDLIILSTGVHAAEMAEIVDRVNQAAPTWNLLGYLTVSDDAPAEVVNRYPVLGPVTCIAEYREAFFVASNGWPAELLPPREWLATLIDPSAFVSRTVTIGAGCVIYPHCYVGLNARLGDGVFMLSGPNTSRYRRLFRPEISDEHWRGLASDVRSDQYSFCLALLEAVEGRRPDVAVVSAAFLDYPWYRETVHRQLPDMIPRDANMGEYVVKPLRPLVYTAQHPGGEEVLRPVGLVLRPPLGEGWGLDDSARLWRRLRMRGLWSPPPGSEWLVRFLTGAYALQLVRLGMVAAREGRAEMALACYREALLFPQEARERGVRRYVYANALLARKQVNEAATQMELAMAEAPWFARGWVLLANIDHIRGDDGAARLHLERALSLLPEQGAEAERAHVSGLLRRLGG